MPANDPRPGDDYRRKAGAKEPVVVCCRPIGDDGERHVCFRYDAPGSDMGGVLPVGTFLEHFECDAEAPHAI